MENFNFCLVFDERKASPSRRRSCWGALGVCMGRRMVLPPSRGLLVPQVPLCRICGMERFILEIRSHLSDPPVLICECLRIAGVLRRDVLLREFEISFSKFLFVSFVWWWIPCQLRLPVRRFLSVKLTYGVSIRSRFRLCTLCLEHV